jgi:hypothetical protein
MSMYDTWARARLDEHTRWLLQVGTGVSTPCPSEAHAEALRALLPKTYRVEVRDGAVHMSNPRPRPDLHGLSPFHTRHLARSLRSP